MWLQIFRIGSYLDTNFVQPFPPTLRKVSEKQYTAVYPKQKLLLHVRRFWNIFGNRPGPKINPLAAKKDEKPLINIILKYTE